MQYKPFEFEKRCFVSVNDIGKRSVRLNKQKHVKHICTFSHPTSVIASIVFKNILCACHDMYQKFVYLCVSSKMLASKILIIKFNGKIDLNVKIIVYNSEVNVVLFSPHKGICISSL